MKTSKASCLKCKHYYSTYQPTLPRGCKVFGIESKQFPSEIVKKHSGQDCLKFESRKSKPLNEYEK